MGAKQKDSCVYSASFYHSVPGFPFSNNGNRMNAR